MLSTAAGVGLAGVAGCSSGEDEVQDSDGDGVVDSQDYAPQDPDVQDASDVTTGPTTDSTEDAEFDFGELTVDPVVSAERMPEPEAVSIDSEQRSGDFYDFSATVQNTGTAGNVGITLVLMPDTSTSPWSFNATQAGQQRLYFDENERRTVEISATREDRYRAYGFRLWPAEVEADVTNEGGSGDVDVELVQSGGTGDGTVLDEQTVQIDGGETRTVSFQGEYNSFPLETDIDEVGFGIEVSPAV
ncbi:hypothetical protein NDI56_01010 [Haloarcula sp. S1CR25-12]|uniref:DUF4352 domain-containing protein n=1 Tax=Haloarcula saliterrae TaxID=2950534 RepID=A0ABU2F6U1_9EURY|nr:hypothetical protein [Haloarcula sp. S1CR25-12]MDS0257982.1 hypothetical protein [Haloarcula sp. S1CR25-12]